MSVRVRTLLPEDSLVHLTVLLHAAYARLGAMGFNYTAVDQSEEVTRRRTANGECLVAEEIGGPVVGTLMVYAPGTSSGTPWYERPDVATIGQFGVDPAYQGRGVGTLLLSEAEQRAVAGGAVELALDTSEGADHLVAWYGRMGFRVVEYAHWKGKTYRSAIMSKPLTTVGGTVAKLEAR